jgi:hypothetical protein
MTIALVVLHYSHVQCTVDLVVDIEGDLVMKGVITNYGSNGEARFGKVCLMMNGGIGCLACRT